MLGAFPHPITLALTPRHGAGAELCTGLLGEASENKASAAPSRWRAWPRACAALPWINQGLTKRGSKGDAGGFKRSPAEAPTCWQDSWHLRSPVHGAFTS